MSSVRMSWSVLLLSVFLECMCQSGLRAYAQAVPVPTVRPPVIVKRRLAAPPREEPCWKKVGISKSAMQERRNVEQASRAEVQSVCANSSLTAQQRREQIRAIHEHTREQVEALISPQQRDALKSCQEARRGGGHPVPGGGFHHGGAEGGPCGELNEPNEHGPEQQP